MDPGNASILRYDMAPHHGWVRTSPHHKHVGSSQEVTESEQPDIGAVLAEVRQYLESTD